MSSHDTTSTGGSPAAAPDLARHLARCTPCRDGLDVMASQRSVLSSLGQARGEGHLVERVLTACAEDGKEKLADLLYELARACLAEATEDTRPADKVSRQPIWGLRDSKDGLIQSASLLWKRTSSDSPGPSAENLSRSDAAQTARSCIKLLEATEGRSGRSRLFEGQIATYCGEYEQAASLLEPMLEEDLSAWVWARLRYSLSTAYLRTGQPGKAAEICASALLSVPGDRVLAFNGATAHAELGDKDGFDRMADVFSESTTPLVEGVDWWRSVIDEESSWFADRLGCTPDSVKRAFEIRAQTGSES